MENKEHNESEFNEDVEDMGDMDMDNMNDSMDFEPSESSGALRFFITLILGIIIGFGGSWLFASRGVSDTEDVINDEVLTDLDGDVAIDDNVIGIVSESSVLVNDQSAGSRVSVAQVVLDRNGWVAIYESENGEPARILGAQLFDRGTDSGVVDLLRPTVVGQTYYAIVHADNGDRTFDLATDQRLADSTGELVMNTFKAI